jgi:hypothetical protein
MGHFLLHTSPFSISRTGRILHRKKNSLITLLAMTCSLSFSKFPLKTSRLNIKPVELRDTLYLTSIQKDGKRKKSKRKGKKMRSENKNKSIHARQAGRQASGCKVNGQRGRHVTRTRSGGETEAEAKRFNAAVRAPI